MSSAFALAKDDFENDDCDDKIKEHMKLVPVRYTKDFSCREEIVLHMDALDCSRKNKGAFAVQSLLVKGKGNDDDQNGEFWEEKNNLQNREDQTDERGEEENEIIFAEKKVPGESFEAYRRERRREGEEIPPSEILETTTTTTTREKEPESNSKRWRSRQRQSAFSGDDDDGAQKANFAPKSRSPLKKLLTGKGTLEKGKISPDSILPDNNAATTSVNGPTSRFYQKRNNQQQQQEQMNHGRGMHGGNLTFYGASTSSSVYSEEGSEDHLAAQALKENEQPFYSLAVACINRPRVLSEISTAVNDCGLDVHEAHIYNLKDGYVLDVFTVYGWKNDDEEGLSHAVMKALTAGIVPERRGLGGSPFPSKTDVNKVCMELDGCEIYDIDPESEHRQGWESHSDDEGEDPLKVSNQMSDSEELMNVATTTTTTLTEGGTYNMINIKNNDDDDDADGGKREIKDNLNRNQISALDSTKSLERDVMEAMEKSRKESKEPAIDSRKLRLIREIGSGSFGVLYKGEYRGKKVAAKFPSGTHNDNQNQLRAMREFFQELSVLSKVKHENIVRVVGAMTKMPRLCIVTEYVDNGPLNNYLLNQGSSLKLSAQVEIACGIARGMAYLHSKNFVHRDLKASNVLLQSTTTPITAKGESIDGKMTFTGAQGSLRPIICDFGLSREVTKDGAMTPETGTYRWMAPEVIAHSKYSLSADVYSFAIVLWEIVCEGHVPYPEHTPLQAAVAVVQKGIRPILPYNSHPIMMNAMERCWVSEPENRPRFTDLVMDFESHMLGSATKLNLMPSKSFFSRLKSMSTSKKRDRI